MPQPPAVDDSETQWTAARLKMLSVVAAFEEHDSHPHLFLAPHERDELLTIMGVAPATRSHSEIRRLLQLLRGSDLLLKLDDDAACTVAGALRLVEYAQGEVVCTEHNAVDAFLLVAEGACTVLVRNTAATPPRSPLFHLQPGECFAESSIMDNSRRGARRRRPSRSSTFFFRLSAFCPTPARSPVARGRRGVVAAARRPRRLPREPRLLEARPARAQVR